ncbi:MAG: hypothetical protein K9K67_11850 [Bacteriovoracaceae bacterium]|nr:hypothetical protein [Bacteriovoracaceae bacterium]
MFRKLIKHILLISLCLFGASIQAAGCDSLKTYLDLAFKRSQGISKAAEIENRINTLVDSASDVRVMQGSEYVSATDLRYVDGALLYRVGDQELSQVIDDDFNNFFRLAGELETPSPGTGFVLVGEAYSPPTGTGFITRGAPYVPDGDVNLPAIRPGTDVAVSRRGAPELPEPVTGRDIVPVVRANNLPALRAGTDVAPVAPPLPRVENLPAIRPGTDVAVTRRGAPELPEPVTGRDIVPVVRANNLPALRAGTDVAPVAPPLPRVENLPAIRPGTDVAVTRRGAPALPEPGTTTDALPDASVTRSAELTLESAPVPSGTRAVDDGLRGGENLPVVRNESLIVREDTLPAVARGDLTVSGNRDIARFDADNVVPPRDVPRIESPVEDFIKGSDGTWRSPSDHEAWMRANPNMTPTLRAEQFVANHSNSLVSVELPDNSVLVARARAVDGDQIELELPGGGTRTIGVNDIDPVKVDDLAVSRFTTDDVNANLLTQDNEIFPGPFNGKGPNGTAIPDDEVLEAIRGGSRIVRVSNGVIELLTSGGRRIFLNARKLAENGVVLANRTGIPRINLARLLRRVGRTTDLSDVGEAWFGDEEAPVTVVEPGAGDTTTPPTVEDPPAEEPPAAFNEDAPGDPDRTGNDGDPVEEEVRAPLPAAPRGRPVAPQMRGINKLQIIRTRGVQ